MTAREEILGRIRTALADQPRPTPVERNYRTSGESWGEDAALITEDAESTDHQSPEAGSPDIASPSVDGPSVESPNSANTLLEILVDRLVDYKATVHRATPETAAEVIAAALAERGASRIIVPDGFPEQLLTAIDPSSIIRDEPPLTAAEMDETDGVLTTSTVAIAESGTIVLDAGPGQGRRALSLVPDYHLCVVRTTDIVRGVPEAIAQLSPENSTQLDPENAGPANPENTYSPSKFGARPLTWISGPSATSDIELQRVEGVHGPRTLAVLLIT